MIQRSKTVYVVDSSTDNRVNDLFEHANFNPALEDGRITVRASCDVLGLLDIRVGTDLVAEDAQLRETGVAPTNKDIVVYREPVKRGQRVRISLKGQGATDAEGVQVSLLFEPDSTLVKRERPQ